MTEVPRFNDQLVHVDEGAVQTGASSPSVGIFWLISSAQKTVLLTQRSPLKDAESYGDCLTHPVGHYELWERLRSLPVPSLKKRGLPVEVKTAEYEYYPRGRVVYETPSDSFVIYADIRLQAPELIRKIIEAFCLDQQTDVTVRSDSHYRS